MDALFVGLFYNSAIFNTDYNICLPGNLRVVGDNDQSLAEFGGAGCEQLQYLLAGFLIQIAGRFVGDDQAGFRQYGTGDGHTLLFASGQFRGEFPYLFLQTHRCDHFLVEGGICLSTVQLQGHQDVILDIVLFQEIELLEHKAHVPAAEDCHLLVIHGTDVLAIHQYFTTGGTIQTAKNVQEGGFTGSASPDNGIEHSFYKIAGDAIQGGNIPGSSGIHFMNLSCG